MAFQNLVFIIHFTYFNLFRGAKTCDLAVASDMFNGTNTQRLSLLKAQSLRQMGVKPNG